MLHKMLDVPDVIEEMTYQWPEDVCQLLGHSVSYCTSGNNGTKGVPCL